MNVQLREHRQGEPPFELGARGRRAGERHEFRCERCGFGAVARIAPERCPVCHGSTWSLVLGRRRESVLRPVSAVTAGADERRGASDGRTVGRPAVH